MENDNMDDVSQEEVARLEALARYRITGTPPEVCFNELASLAKRVFELPICLISFVGKDEVFFKANFGLGRERAEPRVGSICELTIKAEGVTVFEDVHQLAHLVDNIFGVRFYAGAPLVTADGYKIGTLCVLGYQPMPFDDRQRDILLGLAKVVMAQAELRLVALDDERLRRDNLQLISSNRQIADHNSNLIEFKEQVVQANRDLETIQETFELLFARAPIAIGICSSPGKVIRQANSALLNLLVKDDKLIGRSIASVIPEVDGQRFLSMLDGVYQHDIPDQATELKLQILVSGVLQTVYVNCSLEPMGRLGDEPNNIMFIMADVTQQVLARELSEEANEVLISAIDAGGMGYTIVEFATGRMCSNAQLKHNYGYPAERELDYPDIFEAMLPKYRNQVKKAVQQAIETNGIYRAEYQVKWEDGSTHWIQAYGKPRYDVHGRVSHVIGLNKIIAAPL